MSLDAETTISPQDTRAEANVRQMLAELEHTAQFTQSDALLRTMCTSTRRSVLQFLQMTPVSPEVEQQLLADIEQTIERVQQISTF